MTKIYEANNHILIHTGYRDPAIHSHMAAHIMISLEKKMCVQIENKELSCYGILIPSDVPHAIDTGDQPVLVFLFDSTTCTANQIKDIQLIPKEVSLQIAHAYYRFAQEQTAASYHKFSRFLFEYLEICDSGHTITEASLVSGFSNSSHFADVHRRVFGLPISQITEKISFVKIQ